ncbi:hypothetical protein [Mucilaginibacter pedocola]|uniref:Uncharacterized protein n=1 Tax=Mucilaginibacter pedocola TaxID=1792845 RepID=A0A1S9PII9_9SPHI|nr:hypothetical protein [Mucilaginibacter pedocola]OOQ60771.1 hypothetical protein BC343_22605 [Mucilaginibacter pedocola]
MHWLADGDFTPVDLLTPEKPYVIEQRYIPLYFFAGDYEGKYNVLSRSGRVEQGDIPISGKFEVLCYGGTQPEKELGFAEAYIPFIDFSTAAPSPKASSATKVIKIKAVEPDTAWQRSGSLVAADQVYQQLMARDSSKEYSHYLKYDTQQMSCIGLPFYYIEFKYNRIEYAVYTNGVTGELIGERPFAYGAKPPTRWRTFWKYFGMGWGIWFLMVVAELLLFGLPDPGVKRAFEPVVNFLSVFLIFILPIALSTLFFGFIKNAYFAKPRRIRQQTLDMILTGRMPAPFA